MRVKTISVTYERKFNLGDFNSATIGAVAWADLDEGEDEKIAYDQLFAEVKDVVKKQSMPLFARLTAKVEELFQGLPVELRQAVIEAEARRSKGQEKAA